MRACLANNGVSRTAQCAPQIRSWMHAYTHASHRPATRIRNYTDRTHLLPALLLPARWRSARGIKIILAQNSDRSLPFLAPSGSHAAPKGFRSPRAEEHCRSFCHVQRLTSPPPFASSAFYSSLLQPKKVDGRARSVVSSHVWITAAVAQGNRLPC